MGTRAVNPLERGDIELIELWVASKKEQLEPAESKFNQEDYGIDDEDPDSAIFGDEDLDHGEYFEQWTFHFAEMLDARLVYLEDLQDFLVWLEYVKPVDEDDLYSFEEIKSKIEIKIEGIEKRNNW